MGASSGPRRRSTERLDREAVQRAAQMIVQQPVPQHVPAMGKNPLPGIGHGHRHVQPNAAATTPRTSGDWDVSPSSPSQQYSDPCSPQLSNVGAAFKPSPLPPAEQRGQARTIPGHGPEGPTKRSKSLYTLDYLQQQGSTGSPPPPLVPGPAACSTTTTHSLSDDACNGQNFDAMRKNHDIKKSPWFDFCGTNRTSLELMFAIRSQRAEIYTGGPTDKPNQDAFSSLVNLDCNTQFGLFSVCDGHGKFGQCASQITCEFLEAVQPSESADTGAIQELVVGAIFAAEDACTNDPRVNCKLSGTTCCTVLITADHLICFNVGDSRAVLGSEDEEGTVTCKALCWDQKPTEQCEAERLIAEHGPDAIAPVRDSSGEPCGPDRVWIGERKQCGLTMTRSIGDVLGKSYGLITDPVISTHTLRNEDHVVIIGSDGLWDFVTNEEAVGISLQQGSPDLAASALRDYATAGWRRDEGFAVDDITVTVIFLSRRAQAEN